MKKELPKPLVIALVAGIALIAILFIVFKINPPPAGSPRDLGGGDGVTAGPGNLAPIGADGKPIDEGKKGN